jgi:ascorbate-specific PTS system EIIC-type component UlaA
MGRKHSVAAALSVAFAAAPFAFALIRYRQTGADLRMLWMALASLIGAAALIAVDRSRRQRLSVGIGSAMMLAITTLLAGLTAMLLGATAAAGVWGVAIVFGICWTISYALAARARDRVDSA